MIGAFLSLAVGIGAWFWLRRIQGAQRARIVDARVAAGAAGESQFRVARRR
jgi:hypothetical protein